MIRRGKPFNTLSRRRRRARTQHIKNQIHRERHRCGGLHYDDYDSENAEAVAAGWIWTWSDVLFLGNSPDVYWNAEIITVDVARTDIVENLVFEEAHSMLSQSQQGDEARIETAPNYNAKGKVVSYTMVKRRGYPLKLRAARGKVLADPWDDLPSLIMGLEKSWKFNSRRKHQYYR